MTNNQPVDRAAVDALATPALRGGGAGAWSISAVERDTGLGKDTLRIWERRYGFPLPERDARGVRAYAIETVLRLRRIKRLLDQGHRPAGVVPLDAQQLQVLEQALDKRQSDVVAAPDDAAVAQALALLRQHDAVALRRYLAQAQARLGLRALVVDLIAPLTTQVGAQWMRGSLRVFEEHLYTEVVQVTLRQALHNLPQSPGHERPRVLLTTLPGEQHGLGLLMAETMLALEGCCCTSLGLQTPVADIAAASAAQRADVVGLSCSAHIPAAALRHDLRELRRALPAQTALWVGAAAQATRWRGEPGVQMFGALDELTAAVADWRASATEAQ